MDKGEGIMVGGKKQNIKPASALLRNSFRAKDHSPDLKQNEEFSVLYLKCGDTCKLIASPVPCLSFFKKIYTAILIESGRFCGIIMVLWPRYFTDLFQNKEQL